MILRQRCFCVILCFASVYLYYEGAVIGRYIYTYTYIAYLYVWRFQPYRKKKHSLWRRRLLPWVEHVCNCVWHNQYRSHWLIHTIYTPMFDIESVHLLVKIIFMIFSEVTQDLDICRT